VTNALLRNEQGTLSEHATTAGDYVVNQSSNDAEEGGASPTIAEEVMVCLRRPLFVWSMLGYAAYAGGILGFSTFGPQFVMGFGYFDGEFAVSDSRADAGAYCEGGGGL